MYRTLVFGEDYSAPALEEILYTALLTVTTTVIVEGGNIASYSDNDIKALLEQSKEQIKEDGEKDLQAGEMPDDAHLEIMELNDSKARGMMAIYQMGNMEDAADGEAGTQAGGWYAADTRDDYEKIIKRGTVKIQNGFACFPDGDPLNENAKMVTPKKDFFDVAMHGTPTAVSFGTEKMNMSPRLLARLIQHSEGYTGQNIRLLCCSTGKAVNGEYCFAEELANILNVQVEAPNMVLYISERGELSVGIFNEGKFETYTPNQRRRIR